MNLLRTIGMVISVILFIIFMSSQGACGSGYVKLMMAPGDHCVLDPVSEKCGGHVNDFSDSHHRQECVSKENFERLWKAGLCHYDNDTPIINRQGYVMCKSDPISDVTIDGIFMHINVSKAESSNDWTKIQVNGHEILSDHVYMLTRGTKAHDHLASLPTVNKEEFYKHTAWMHSHPNPSTEDWKEYCKELPNLCK